MGLAAGGHGWHGPGRSDRPAVRGGLGPVARGRGRAAAENPLDEVGQLHRGVGGQLAESVQARPETREAAESLLESQQVLTCHFEPLGGVHCRSASAWSSFSTPAR